MAQPTEGMRCFNRYPSPQDERVQVALSSRHPSTTITPYNSQTSSVSPALLQGEHRFSTPPMDILYQSQTWDDEVFPLSEPESMAAMCEVVERFVEEDLDLLGDKILEDINSVTIRGEDLRSSINHYKQLIDGYVEKGRDLQRQAQTVSSTAEFIIPGVRERLNTEIDCKITDIVGKFQRLSEVAAIKDEIDQIRTLFAEVEWSHGNATKISLLEQQLIELVVREATKIPLSLMKIALTFQSAIEGVGKENEKWEALKRRGEALRGLEKFCQFLRETRDLENNKDLIEKEFNRLSFEIKNAFYEKIWSNAGKPQGNPNYGQVHLFDDLGLLQDFASDHLYEELKKLKK